MLPQTVSGLRHLSVSPFWGGWPCRLACARRSASGCGRSSPTSFRTRTSKSWIPFSAYIRLPNWFKEGLAVMASDGGGAEWVDEAEARAAIQRGERIAIDDAGSLLNLAAVNFERPPARGSAAASPATVHPQMLAYREAGMFVTYLHRRDETAFARMMNAIL